MWHLIIVVVLFVANMLCAALNIDAYVHRLDVINLLVAFFNLSAAGMCFLWIYKEI